jgi:hypothetical protein
MIIMRLPLSSQLSVVASPFRSATSVPYPETWRANALDGWSGWGDTLSTFSIGTPGKEKKVDRSGATLGFLGLEIVKVAPKVDVGDC